jgi:hypothetical protein
MKDEDKSIATYAYYASQWLINDKVQCIEHVYSRSQQPKIISATIIFIVAYSLVY